MDGVVEIGWRHKMHVDGDETKIFCPEKTAPFIKVETTPIEQVSKHRLLGVTVDDQLKYTHLCKTVSQIFFFFRN